MSGILGGGKSSPPPMAQAAPPPPTNNDAADAAASAEAARDAKLRRAQGYKSTILTSGAGDTTDPTVAKKTLLGA